MRYFMDTEFIEDGTTIELISIGIVCEDGREYYAVNSDCDFSRANPWVRENVIPLLPPRNINLSDPSISPQVKERSLAWQPRWYIRNKVAEFMGCKVNSIGLSELYPSRPEWLRSLRRFLGIPVEYKETPDYEVVGESPEIWAYYADYDWIAFCQLFGTMMDLPKGFPMYCNDLKQECVRLGNPELPPQINEHNALADARWVMETFDYLKRIDS